MAKTNSGFKIGKMVKLFMGAIQDPAARKIYKDAMIDAIQTYNTNKHRKPRENNSNTAAE